MTLQERLADIVGAAHVLTEAAQTQPYLTDWRKQYSGAAECVVRPGSTEEVARVVALCAGEGVAMVPQGGNTGLVGGQIPQGEILLSTDRLRAIREIDTFDDVLVAEAGVKLAAVHEAAAAVRRRFPLGGVMRAASSIASWSGLRAARWTSGTL